MQELSKLCVRAKAKVAKVARMKFGELKNILKIDNKLRVIFYVRDPRAIMTSRIKMQWQGSKSQYNVSSMADSLCKKMKKDYTERTELAKIYPNRIETIYYENLAENPISESMSIFKFAGWSFSDSDKVKIEQMTSGDINYKSQEAYDNTFRVNSVLTSLAWKSKIDPTHLELINRVCGDVYELLGYQKYIINT